MPLLVADLHQGGAIRHRIGRLQAAEPPVAHVHPELVDEPHLGQVVEVAEEDHPDDHFGIPRRPATVRVAVGDLLANPGGVEYRVESPQQVIGLNQLVDIEDMKHVTRVELLLVTQHRNALHAYDLA